MLPEFMEFYLPTRVIYGLGSVSERLPVELEQLGGERALLVADPGVNAAGLVGPIRDAMEASSVSLAAEFLEVPADSSVEVVEELGSLAREAGVQSIVAVGGGSVIDTAKAASILIQHGGDLEDYQGIHVLEEALPPMVAIPTTAGTGSEVSPFAVIKDHTSHTKLHFVSHHLYPRLAVLDPELSRTLPPRLTAATGADALTHALESYISSLSHPITDSLSLGAAGEIIRWLPKAVQSGDDLEARGRMLLASLLAGGAMSNAAVGCVHALAHALGGIRGVHHGVANGLFLHQGITFNAEVAGDRVVSLWQNLAPAFGQDTPRTADLDGPGAADHLSKAIEEFLRGVGLPRQLREVDVPREGLEEIAMAAAVDGAMFTNPRPAGAEELLPILEATW